MPKMDIDGDALCAGDTVECADQTFTVEKIGQYTRKSDGQPGRILHWLGACADCGLPLRFTSGSIVASFSLRHRTCYLSSVAVKKAPVAPKTPKTKPPKTPRPKPVASVNPDDDWEERQRKAAELITPAQMERWLRGE